MFGCARAPLEASSFVCEIHRSSGRWIEFRRLLAPDWTVWLISLSAFAAFRVPRSLIVVLVSQPSAPSLRFGTAFRGGLAVFLISCVDEARWRVEMLS